MPEPAAARLHDLLVVERAIERQLIGVARAMDRRDWPAFGEIARADLVADFGLDAVVDHIRRFLDRCGPTQHLLGNVVIDADLDAGTATSQAYVNDRHVGAAERAELSFETLGDYHDTWTLTDGVWRLASRTKYRRASIGTLDVFLG
ncbi:MAG TPA: nuclear transport factor 2 family protein [Ilumatobacteraceae bacterium]|nr:nuclear transport factor 2 family protein [Ilumatobacteraceae bacterium]